MGRATGCERVHTLSRSPGAVLAGIWISNGAGLTVLVENSVSDETGVGRSAPLHPLGGRGARGFTPSRALPWGCTGRDLSFRRCRHSGEEFGFRRSGRGALRSPTPPRVTGSERAATLSRSPGAVLAGIWISDGAGIPAKNLVSGEAGVGRSAPLHPLG